jgi:hypothetical protein
MAYMTDFSTCPDTHPILLPQLMYQAEFHMDGIPKDAKPTDFVLANGDATMASFHADYIAGFDEGVLLVSWSHVYATRARTGAMAESPTSPGTQSDPIKRCQTRSWTTSRVCFGRPSRWRCTGYMPTQVSHSVEERRTRERMRNWSMWSTMVAPKGVPL